MMDPMHARRHHNQVQQALQFNRQTPVGMMKESRSFQCDEEDHQHYRSDTEEHHRKGEKSDGENHLTKMKSRSSAYIQIEIRVMHVMKSPEQRNHMVRPMPPPIGVIHQ